MRDQRNRPTLRTWSPPPSSSPWPRLTQLTCVDGGGTDGAGPSSCVSSRRVGPQLTTLKLQNFDQGLCAVIATGVKKLTDIDASAGPAVSAQLCDALTASGAPLHRVGIDWPSAEDGLRLVDAVPSIRDWSPSPWAF